MGFAAASVAIPYQNGSTNEPQTGHGLSYNEFRDTPI